MVAHELDLVGFQKRREILFAEPAAQHEFAPRFANRGSGVFLDVPGPEIADPEIRWVPAGRLEIGMRLVDEILHERHDEVACDEPVSESRRQPARLRVVRPEIDQRRFLGNPLGLVTVDGIVLARIVHELAWRDVAQDLEALARLAHHVLAPLADGLQHGAAAADHDHGAAVAEFVQRVEQVGHLQRVQLVGRDGHRAHQNVRRALGEQRQREERVARPAVVAGPDATKAVALGHQAEFRSFAGGGEFVEDDVDFHGSVIVVLVRARVAAPL